LRLDPLDPIRVDAVSIIRVEFAAFLTQEFRILTADHVIKWRLCGTTAGHDQGARDRCAKPLATHNIEEAFCQIGSGPGSLDHRPEGPDDTGTGPAMRLDVPPWAKPEAQALWDGLRSGAIGGLDAEEFAETLAEVNAHMQTLGLGSVAEAGNLNLAQITAAVNETTPEMVDQARAAVAAGAEIERDVLRELGIRGVSEGALNRINMERVAIWFGILVLIVVEVGLITPPVGMNLFVINAMDPSTRMLDTYRSVLPFVASDLIRVTILVLIPAITLFLIPLF